MYGAPIDTDAICEADTFLDAVRLGLWRKRYRSTDGANYERLHARLCLVVCTYWQIARRRLETVPRLFHSRLKSLNLREAVRQYDREIQSVGRRGARLFISKSASGTNVDVSNRRLIEHAHYVVW